jgi:predicted phosphodiesterase
MNPSDPILPDRLTRRSFLGQAPFAAGFASIADRCLGAADATGSGGSGGTSTCFVVGDTHYRADETDDTSLDPVSADYNGRLVDWLNRLPGSPFPETLGGGVVPVPDGVIHAGDIVDNGDKGEAVERRKVPVEWSSFEKDWGLNGTEGRLRWPVREVHGNHDSPRGEGIVIEGIRGRNALRKGITARSDSGLHYSWDWAGVHFVALGIVAGDAPEVTRPRRYAPLGSLPFLREDLAKHVGDSGRPVVLVHHVDAARYSVAVDDEKARHQEWDHGDVRAYYESLAPYRVAAAICGHTHVRNLFRWNGTQDTRGPSGIPFLNTDNAAHFHGPAQAFLHLEISASEVRVREFATRDGWTTGAWTPQVWRFSF